MAHEERVSKMFNAADEEPGRARRLRGMVSASRGELEGERASISMHPVVLKTVIYAQMMSRKSPAIRLTVLPIFAV